MFEPMRILTQSMDPPKRVRVHPGLRHVTVVARFGSADGLTGNVKVKLPRERA